MDMKSFHLFRFVGFLKSEASMNAQENFYSFWMEFIYKHEFQKSGNDAIDEYKRGILAYILQTWIADVGPNTLNQPIKIKCL